MLPPHIHSPQDLVTTREAIRRGFLDQAVQKASKAAPYIVQAENLREQLKQVDRIEAHATSPELRVPLLAAIGLSDKARGRLTSVDLDMILEAALSQIVQTYPDTWREQLVYRYLLNRGDTLGGSMRNLTGAAGATQLTAATAVALERSGADYAITRAPKNTEKIVRIAWGNRLLVFDRKPRFIDKSVDALLLEAADLLGGGISILERPNLYIACGELKGGIDTAGADEHWKTARSAFERIRDSFQRKGIPPPGLFFVAAAIEQTMAKEIYADLESGRLTYAANLTKPEQLEDLASWLVAL